MTISIHACALSIKGPCLFLLVLINVLSCSPLPMSYHRVLPVPEALVHPNPARSQEIGVDSLVQHRIMTNERRVSSSRRSKSPASSQRSSSPVADKHQDTPSVNSVEDPDYEDSPEPRDRSSSQQSNREVRRLPSISKAWQAESPSDICLCQPDPKVPRPRNGMQIQIWL